MPSTQSQRKPKLRFPEFNDEWKSHRLSEFLTRYSENNRDQEFSIDDILSLSSRYGIVNRKELLKDTYDKVNHLNYKKTRLNDFIYGKSISANFPFGLFKINDYKDGLLSTLYFTFKVKKDVFPKFLDFYFSYPNRANKFLRNYVLVGDRYITADADYLLSGQISLPSYAEQQKITSFLGFVDEWLKKLENERNLLREYKKGVVQKIFSKEIRLKNKTAKSFPGWEEKRFGDIFSRIQTRNSEKNSNILTISAQQGLVQQDSFFKRLVSSKDVSNYFLLDKGDFAYNKSYSKDYPMGAIKRLAKFDKGVVSPLYICFRINDNNYSQEYFDHYFDSGLMNRSIHRIAQEGARNHGLLNISVKEFFDDIKIMVPCFAEQIKIAEFLGNLNLIIETKDTQVRLANEWRKGLLQKIFI